MFQFTTTREASRINGVKIIVYGKAGYGKTTLCATAPSPLIISAESGMLALRKYDIPVVEISNVTQLSEVYDWISGSQEANQFSTICIDSVSEIAEVVLANAKGQVKDPRQAYGELIDKMGNTIRKFRDLPGKHVYMAAKQQMQKDSHTGAMMYGPGMPGSKLGEAMPYFPDEVFRLGIAKDPATQQDYRFLQTQPDFQHDAKDRSGALDPVEPPDLSHVINKILGDL